jgi:hypothetical protein
VRAHGEGERKGLVVVRVRNILNKGLTILKVWNTINEMISSCEGMNQVKKGLLVVLSFYGHTNDVVVAPTSCINRYCKSFGGCVWDTWSSPYTNMGEYL